MLRDKVVEEFAGWVYAGYQEMIAGPCAGDVEQVAFGSVDLVEFGLIADALCFDRGLGSFQFGLRPDEHAYFVRVVPVLTARAASLRSRPSFLQARGAPV